MRRRRTTIVSPAKKGKSKKVKSSGAGRQRQSGGKGRASSGRASLASAVCKALERVFESRSEGCECVAGTLILFCLNRALKPEALLSDVARLNKHREALTHVELFDQSGTALRSML
eukprot:Selendium_serpulae@DN10481_c0_g1_i1.p1